MLHRARASQDLSFFGEEGKDNVLWGGGGEVEGVFINLLTSVIKHLDSYLACWAIPRGKEHDTNPLISLFTSLCPRWAHCNSQTLSATKSNSLMALQGTGFCLSSDRVSLTGTLHSNRAVSSGFRLLMSKWARFGELSLEVVNHPLTEAA